MIFTRHLYKVFVFVLLLISFLSGQARQRTAHWNLRNELFNSELDSVSEGATVFLGNSITEGFDLSFYFPDARMINRGIIGDHLDGLLERLHNSAVGLKPEKLFLMIGINDIGDQRSDDYLKAMFITLIDTLRSELPETDIYLHSILPTSPRWKNCPPDQIKRMNAFLAVLAREKGVVYVNLYPTFLGNNGYINMDLSRDGLHLNAAGYERWVEIIKSLLEY